jgi:hypothetical protein
MPQFPSLVWALLIAFVAVVALSLIAGVVASNVKGE